MIYYKEEKKKLVIPSGFVMIPIDCDEAIEQAREDGYREGFADGSSAACDTEEGTYSLTDDFDGEETVFPSEGKTGFNKIVIVDDGYGDAKYDEGYADGIADCSGSTPCDCSSAVTEAYQSGITEGIAEQKALLSSTAITENGTYTSENGWNSVTVDVPAPPIIRVEKRFNLESGDTSPWTVRPDWTTYMTDVIITDNGYGQGKYAEGYEAGVQACSGSSCTLEEGRLDISDFWGGGPTVVYPSTADGFSQFTVEDTNGSYAQKHYMDGYNDGLAQCSGGTCNLESGQVSLGYDWTGFTRVYPSQGYDGLSDVIVADLGYGQRKFDEGYADGHTSGYTEGYNEAITANCGTAIDEAYESGVTVGYIDSSKVAYFDQPAFVDTGSLDFLELGDVLHMRFTTGERGGTLHLLGNLVSGYTDPITYQSGPGIAIDFLNESGLGVYIYGDPNEYEGSISLIPFSNDFSPNSFCRWSGDTYSLFFKTSYNSYGRMFIEIVLVNETRENEVHKYVSDDNRIQHFSSGVTNGFRINCVYDEDRDEYDEMNTGFKLKSLKVYKDSDPTFIGGVKEYNIASNIVWYDGKLFDTVSSAEHTVTAYDDGSLTPYYLPSENDNMKILW